MKKYLTPLNLTLFFVVLLIAQYFFFFLEKRIWVVIAYHFLDFLYSNFNITLNYFPPFYNWKFLGQFLASFCFGISNFFIIQYVRKHFIFNAQVVFYLLFIFVCLTLILQYDVDDTHRCLWVHSCWTGL